MKRMLLIILAAFIAAPSLVAAERGGGASSGFQPERLLFGAGISRNDISGSDDGTGFQIFGGYRFGEVAKNVSLDAEVGYMDTGDMDTQKVANEAEGIWATAVVRLAVNPTVDLLGRLGLDFGDDDGLMLGIGVGFNANKNIQLRGELVERDNVSSLQFNFVYFQ